MNPVSKWINGLLGKPAPRMNDVPADNLMGKDTPQVEPEPVKQQKAVQTNSNRLSDEDSVIKDLTNLKRFFSGKLGKASDFTKNKSQQNLSKVKGSKTAMTFVKLFVFIFVLLLVSLIAYKLLVKVQKDTAQNVTPTPQDQNSPTPINYQPYEPSIYAEDSEVLRIEEYVDVLEKEITRAQLRESRFLPPLTDYNINFLK